MLFAQAGEVVVGFDRRRAVGGVARISDFGFAQDGIDIDGGHTSGIIDIFREHQTQVVRLFLNTNQLEIGLDFVQFVTQLDDRTVQFVAACFDVLHLSQQGFTDTAAMQNNQGVGAGWCDTTSDGILQNFFALGGFTQVLFCGLLQLDAVADVGDTGFLQATDFVRQLAVTLASTVVKMRFSKFFSDISVYSSVISSGVQLR